MKGVHSICFEDNSMRKVAEIKTHMNTIYRSVYTNIIQYQTSYVLVSISTECKHEEG